MSPPTVLKVCHHGGFPVYYRPDTSDERVLTEVITNHCYRKVSFDFDVEQGEKWLDLGANIGAFAVYCRLRGATAVCYEPDHDCYTLLTKNAPTFTCHNEAVTHHPRQCLPFWSSNKDDTHTRGTCFPQRMKKGSEPVEVRNFWAKRLTGTYDGIKMDIEGAEFGLIDEWLLPPCEKLVFEYHTSRDPSLENLARRLEILKEKFKEVKYPPEYDRMLEQGEGKPFADRVIFCKGRK